MSALGPEFNWRPITGRGYSEYLEWLNLDEADLQGKVLDLGAGLGRFAREAAEKGIDVVALDPQLYREEIRQCYLDAPYIPNLSAVAAEAHDMPFEDSSFDTVISLFAVPLEVGRANYEEVYREIFRVLRAGGKAYLTPLNETDLKISIPLLIELGIPHSLRTVDTPFGPMHEWQRLTIEK